MSLSRYTTLLSCLALLALVFVVYWPGLSGGFLFDDYPNIVTNRQIQIDHLGWDALWTATHAYGGGYVTRPLAMLSFALNYLVGEKAPFGYKATNLAVHLANALLVFWLVRRVLASVGNAATWSKWAPFAIALLWAVHPIQISSVLYVVQRMELLSLTFVLAGLVVYLGGRLQQQQGKSGWFRLVAGGLIAALGLLSKETAILFPLYTLVLELTVLGFRAQSPLTTRHLKLAYAGGLAVAAAVYVYTLPTYLAPDAFAGRDFSLYERLLTQCRVLPMYIGQILLPLPANLTFYYDDYAKSTGWLQPATTLAGAAVVIALLVAGWKARRRAPVVSLGILWFFAAHVLTSNVFNVELVFEHRNYFASLGILLALADLVRRLPVRDSERIKVAGVAAVVIGFGMLGVIRAASWGNPLLLAMDMASRNPTSARASNDLGEQYMIMSDFNASSPFYGMAQQEFERGSRLASASPLPEQALILMAASSDQPAKPEWWARLIHKIETRPLGPQEQVAIVGLMTHRYDGLPIDDRQLATALATMFRRSVMPAHAYALYGDYALTYLKDEALAERLFVAAIERQPDDAEYTARVFAGLTADGRGRQALAVYRRALELGLMTGPAVDQAVGMDAPASK